MIKLTEFIKPELDKFRDLCNFTPEELRYFDLRSSGSSNIEIAMAMHISESKVSKLAKKVKTKILKIV